MQGNHVDAVFGQFHIERVGVVSPVADELPWHGLNHVKVKAQLYQRNRPQLQKLQFTPKLEHFQKTLTDRGKVFAAELADRVVIGMRVAGK